MLKTIRRNCSSTDAIGNSSRRIVAFGILLLFVFVARHSVKLEQPDRGIPLLCVHKSSPQLTNLIDEFSQSRATLDRPTSKRQRELTSRAREAFGEKPGAHSCLVVGYNKESEEVAVSNSWQGKSGNIWIPFEVFSAMSARADFGLFRATLGIESTPSGRTESWFPEDERHLARFANLPSYGSAMLLLEFGQESSCGIFIRLRRQMTQPEAELSPMSDHTPPPLVTDALTSCRRRSSSKISARIFLYDTAKQGAV
jgi:hypothetical protein